MTGQLLTRGHLADVFKADLDEQRSPCGRLNSCCHHPRSSYLEETHFVRISLQFPHATE